MHVITGISHTTCIMLIEIANIRLDLYTMHKSDGTKYSQI